MLHFFGLWATIKVFLIEFSFLIGAGICVILAIGLLSIRIAPQLLEKWTGIEALKKTLAYVLFGVAVGLSCWFGGFRQARKLDTSLIYQYQLAQAEAQIVADKIARERDAKLAEDLAQQLTDLEMSRQSEEKSSTALRKIIADMAAKDPKDAKAKMSPIVRAAIRGASK